MKFYILSLVFLLLSGHAYTQTAEIAFEEKSYEEILASLKDEDAIGLLYFQFDGCGACIKMEEQVFEVDSIAAYYNTHFKNYSIDTKTPAGEKIKDRYKAKTQPTFVFIDGYGNELHRFGAVNADRFYTQGVRFLETGASLYEANKQYEQGDRSAEFLYEYSYILRDANQTDSTVINDYLETQSYQDYSEEKNIRYIYEFCFVNNFKEAITIEHSAFQHMWENRELYGQFFEQEQVDIRLLRIAARDAYESKTIKEFEKAAFYLRQLENKGLYYYKEIDDRITFSISTDNLTLRLKMVVLKRIGDMDAYYQTRSNYVSLIFDDPEKLNEYAWKLYKRSRQNPEELDHAIECIERSIHLKEEYNNLDTYAHLLYLKGANERALQMARKAIALAKPDSLDYSATEKLIEKMISQ